MNPPGLSFEPSDETVQRTLEELESLSGKLEFELGSAEVSRLDIKVVQIPEDEIPVNRAGRWYRILRISAEIPLPDNNDLALLT